MTHLHCDFETSSTADLKKVGLDNYARDPSTRALMMSFQFDNARPVLWLPHKTKLPLVIRDAVEDRSVTKIAHNAAFEIEIFRHVLGVDARPDDWHCTMIMALSLGLPAQLAQLVRDALQLDRKYWKDERGEKLIAKFCYPAGAAKITEPWITHAKDFSDFGEYCIQDTVAEAKVYSILRRYVPDLENVMREWRLGQVINERGLPVDVKMIETAQRVAKRVKTDYKQTMIDMTGLANPNSTQQILPWLQDRGYPFSSLGKDRVSLALREFGDNITAEAKEVIRLRQESNKTSLTKYDAILRCSHGGRLRNTFLYCGAAATGRYAGRILGQNMPRPSKAVEGYEEYARELLLREDVDGLRMLFGPPLDVLASLIRTAIAPEPGLKLAVADLSSIELCVVAWQTKCQFWTDVVFSGKDAYKAFAEQWLQKPYAEVTKFERGLSKPPALGCGYRMGPGRKVGREPDITKTGLWGYAENMGVRMTKEQCKTAVKVYRDLSPEVVQFWRDLDNASLDCVHTGEPQTVGMLTFDMKPPFLRMRLPSGRYVHYCRPRIEDVEIEYENEAGETETMVKRGLTYERLSQTSNKWVRRANHGGRFTEQSTQAISKDLLQLAIEECEAEDDLPVIGHYHDEVLTEPDALHEGALGKVLNAMRKGAPWTKGLFLGAAGYEGTFYKKG
jgi:DNA polymerase